MPTIERILVPTDFSPASDHALDYARMLAGRFGASIDMVHVFEDPFSTGAFVGDGSVMMPLELRDSLLESAREQLAQRHAAHRESLPKSTSEVVTGSAARAIVERATTSNTDIIVMGTHGRTGIPHLLMGSVAERVVRTAHCPVLTARHS